MCGRYLLVFTTKHLQNMQQVLEQKHIDQYHTGEIFPSHLVPVLTLENDHLDVCTMTWGFTNPYNTSLVINARSETIYTKKLFQEAIYETRCVVPANGFYEWKQESTHKQKYLFQSMDCPTVYMAAIYRIINNQKQFTIITTKANSYMSEYHHRMPIILSKEEVIQWLTSPFIIPSSPSPLRETSV